ncbi:hypothetical protein V8C43DRAFT_267985 [Trichoderma afarasin]
MAYEGGYGGQQRPYAGSAAQAPMARGYGGRARIRKPASRCRLWPRSARPGERRATSA